LAKPRLLEPLPRLVLALTPIVVATSRNNTQDMLVVLTVLIAAWEVVRFVMRELWE
jgi:4-amino-4-deoxy-L-arabinose transferase-like glycosyltransferase